MELTDTKKIYKCLSIVNVSKEVILSKFYDNLDENLEKFYKRTANVLCCHSAKKWVELTCLQKGLDCFRILGPNKVAYLNLTGSGNETSAHLLEDNRMTIMFCNYGRATKHFTPLRVCSRNHTRR